MTESGAKERTLEHLVPIVPIGFSSPVAEALPKAVRRIVEALQPEKIILFGSYAYGRPTADSDVDLLIVMETSASASERYLAVSRLVRPRPFPVDTQVKRVSLPRRRSKTLSNHWR